MQIFNGVIKQRFSNAVKNEAKRIISKLPEYDSKKVIYTLPRNVRNMGWQIVDCINCMLFKYDSHLNRDAFDPSYTGEITIYPERIKTLKERNRAVSDELDRLVVEMKLRGLTDYEKARTIVNKVCEVFEYCKERDKKGYLVHSDTYPYDLVMVKCGVCSGYSKLFCMLCDKVGLESQYLDNEDHAWNRVKVNGQWLYVDCTWDDVGDHSANYFSLTPKDVFKSKGHPMHKRVGWDCWQFKEV